MPDMELARLKQTESDLESLAKYRALKMQAYDSWSKSMGKEFTYYNKYGILEKIDVAAKRADASTTQDSLAGTEIGPQFSVRKAYKEHLSDPTHGTTPWSAAVGSLPGMDRRGTIESPLRWTPIPPPLDLTWFDRVCIWLQRLIKRTK